MSVKETLGKAERGSSTRHCLFIDLIVGGGIKRGKARGVGIRGFVGECQIFLAQIRAFFLHTPAGITAWVAILVI